MDRSALARRLAALECGLHEFFAVAAALRIPGRGMDTREGYANPDEPRARAGPRSIVDALLTRLQGASGAELAWTEAQWAADLGVSRSQLSRLVHRQTGLRFGDVRRWARLSHAAYLLQQTTLPIKAVADLSGFRGASQCCDEFTATVGLSPRAFRALICTPAE